MTETQKLTSEYGGQKGLRLLDGFPKALGGPSCLLMKLSLFLLTLCYLLSERVLLGISDGQIATVRVSCTPSVDSTLFM